MNRAPKPRTVWSSGILIRSAVLYLPLGFLLGRHSSLSLLPGIALLLEALCLWLYRSAQGGNGRPLLLLSYLSVGDIVWFFGALTFGMLSTVMPLWGYAGMVIVWLAALGVNIHIIRRLGISGGRDAELSSIIIGAEIGSAAKYVVLRKMENTLTVWVSFGLIGIGLLGVMTAFIVGQDNWLLLSLSVVFLGLSCGFSPQIRPLLLVMQA